MAGIGSFSNMPQRGLLLISFFIFIGFVLRLLGVFNDLWLDEIWVLLDLENGANPWSALFEGSNGRDGRASLYTLIVSLLIEHDPEILRAPSLLASLIFLVLICHYSKAEGVFTAAITTFFASFSFVLVLYASEARGYSIMATCALASYVLLDKLRAQQKVDYVNLVSFWCISVIGLLFHFSFSLFYFALALSDFHLQKDKIGRKIIRHAPLVCLFSGFYFAYVRYLPPGSGTLSSYADVLIDTINISLGGPILSPALPLQSSFAVFCALAVVVILGLEISLLRKDRDERWFFYFLITLIVPILLILVIQPRYLAVRYFLPSIIFLYPLLATFLVRIWRGSIFGRGLALLIALLFIFGNLNYLISFMKNGRGSYAEALIYIERTTKQDETLSIGSDHDFRNRVLIEYYGRLLDIQDIAYVTQEESAKKAPTWFITHSQDPYFKAPLEIELYSKRYRLQRTFPFTALSGWSWMVYR